MKEFVCLSVLYFLLYHIAISLSQTISKSTTDSEVCTANGDGSTCRQNPSGTYIRPGIRYLLYDTTFYEGFNLRVNTYMRMANLVRFLNLEPGQEWVLVLPPWSQMKHWMNRHIPQHSIPWEKFFDVDSIRRYIPAIEHEEFIRVGNGKFIDELYWLQDYKGGWDFWKKDDWEAKMDVEKCHQETGVRKDENGLWRHWFWGYRSTRARKFKCLSVQSQAVDMRHFLIKKTQGRSVVFLHAEQLLHGDHGEWTPQWWAVRRSLRFAKPLRDIADEFRAKNLDSDDERDKTVLKKSWTDMKTNHGDAVGGPYAALHLRRADYEQEHHNNIPSLKSSASQIKKLMKKHKLDTLFVATDAKYEQLAELKKYLPKKFKVLRFEYDDKLVQEVLDGGIAIIDQWIAIHARVFMGSFRSTFSFRIQEEREILGFGTSTTYNQLCPETDLDCIHKSQWEVVWDN